MRYELTRGLAYLRIRHPSIRWYTTWFPAVLTALACGVYLLLPAKPPLLGKDGLFSSMLGLVSTLPGFYLAALAAVATFDRPGMDVEISHSAPVIDVEIQGVSEPVSLTRRMFLSYLFSYLTTLSLILCVEILLLNALQPSIVVWAGQLKGWELSPLVMSGGRILLLACIVAPLSALAISTLHGIFFLTEKLHQPY